MVIRFSEEFSSLVVESVPQVSYRSAEGRGGYLNEEDYGRLPFISNEVMPDDGFIARFCEEY